MTAAQRSKTAVHLMMEKRGLPGGHALARAMADAGHPISVTQAHAWSYMTKTPRPAAMKALARVLGVSAGKLATAFLAVHP